MKSSPASALLGALLAGVVQAVPTVDDRFPYTGPAIPVGDWVDPTVDGNGKGFPRLVEPPAVKPATDNPSNNINVIALSYIPGGINIHYQTPFGLGEAPSISWGSSLGDLGSTTSGYSHTYDRTPPCSLVAAVTQCSQFFHEVQIGGLKADTTYYYQIAAANGTTASDVLSFTTARAAGDSKAFSLAVLNDMGYTNAMGTFTQLNKAVDEGIAFAWHGGDLSYADDWYSGILPCESDWPVCYNGTSTELPGGFATPDEYKVPLPAGEIANQGGPLGGDMSVIYESNWDLWQQWVVNITAKVPYMVLPGNHEASCSEFDGPGNPLTAYLNNNITNGTAAKSDLTYYSCPPSQRNFTAFQNRFRMPGAETGGVGNMWYSFDYGLAHFISLDGETDYAKSPSWPFARDATGTETLPTEKETYVTDAGPFGTMGNYSDTKTFGQYQWLAKDLASIDRTKTPWIIVMTHRPMYSSQVSSYQAAIRNAFQPLLLQYGVDAYLSGHIHWYERLWPLTNNGSIDTASILNNNTYYTNSGVSMTHIINGMAGNIESHSTLDAGESTLPITAYLDFQHYGFNKIEVNSTALTFSFVTGGNGTVLDKLTLLKRTPSTSSSSTSSSSTSATSSGTSTSTSFSSGATTSTSSSGTFNSTGVSSGTATSDLSSGASTSLGTSPLSVATSSSSIASPGTAVLSSYIGSTTSIAYTTETVTAYTIYCPGPTIITQGSGTYTVTEATTVTITNCPCTVTYVVTPSLSLVGTTNPVVSVITSGTVATTYTISEVASSAASIISSAVPTSNVLIPSSPISTEVPLISVISSGTMATTYTISGSPSPTTASAVTSAVVAASSGQASESSETAETSTSSTTSTSTSASLSFTGGANRASVTPLGGITGLIALVAYYLL